MSHAFSARALRDQEDVIHLYVDKLVAQLGKLGKNGKEAVDATNAWNWLTFDVIGEHLYLVSLYLYMYPTGCPIVQ